MRYRYAPSPIILFGGPPLLFLEFFVYMQRMGTHVHEQIHMHIPSLPQPHNYAHTHKRTRACTQSASLYSAAVRIRDARVRTKCKSISTPAHLRLQCALHPRSEAASVFGSCRIRRRILPPWHLAHAQRAHWTLPCEPFGITKCSLC